MRFFSILCVFSVYYALFQYTMRFFSILCVFQYTLRFFSILCAFSVYYAFFQYTMHFFSILCAFSVYYALFQYTMRFFSILCDFSVYYALFQYTMRFFSILCAKWYSIQNNIPHRVGCIVYTMHCMYTVQCIMYIVHRNEESVRCAVCNMKYTMYKISNMNLTIKFTTPSETTMLRRKGKNLHTIT